MKKKAFFKIFFLVGVLVVWGLAAPSVWSQRTEYSVDLMVSPERYLGPCPKKFVFSGKIAATGAGRIHYQFIRSDGAKSPVYTHMFKEAGVAEVSMDWTLSENYEGWVILKILRPVEIESTKVSFRLTCQEKRETARSEASTALQEAVEELGRPDLIIESFTVKRDRESIFPGRQRGGRPGQMKVKISGWVKNVSTVSTASSLTAEGEERNCRGDFKLRLVASTPKTATPKTLRIFGIQALGPDKARHFSFEEWVDLGQERRYSVAVDHLNWIREKDEENNMAVKDLEWR